MKKVLAIAALCLLLGVGVSHASPIVWGTTNYSYTGANAWTASIYWEVYAPYDSSSYLNSIAEYSYFYTITNNPTSIGSISQFSLANPAKLTVTSQGYQDTSGITPASYFDNGDSMDWFFQASAGNDGRIDPGETSDRLYVTSPYQPALVDAGLIGSGGTEYNKVPGLAPEPASMVLFGLGLVGFGARVARKKFMA